jgi:hypothetical protein
MSVAKSQAWHAVDELWLLELSLVGSNVPKPHGTNRPRPPLETSLDDKGKVVPELPEGVVSVVPGLADCVIGVPAVAVFTPVPLVPDVLFTPVPLVPDVLFTPVLLVPVVPVPPDDCDESPPPLVPEPVMVELTVTVAWQLAVPLGPVKEPKYVVCGAEDGSRLIEPETPTLPMLVIAPPVALELCQ